MHAHAGALFIALYATATATAAGGSGTGGPNATATGFTGTIATASITATAANATATDAATPAPTPAPMTTVTATVASPAPTPDNTTATGPATPTGTGVVTPTTTPPPSPSGTNTDANATATVSVTPTATGGGGGGGSNATATATAADTPVPAPATGVPSTAAPSPEGTPLPVATAVPAHGGTAAPATATVTPRGPVDPATPAPSGSKENSTTATATATGPAEGAPSDAGAGDDDDGGGGGSSGATATAVVLSLLLIVYAVIAVLLYLRLKKQKKAMASELEGVRALNKRLVEEEAKRQGGAADINDSPRNIHESEAEMKRLGDDLESMLLAGVGSGSPSPRSPKAFAGFGGGAAPSFPLYDRVGVGASVYTRDMELRDVPTLQSQLQSAHVEETHVLVRGRGEQDIWEGEGDVLTELCDNLNFPADVEPMACLGCIAHHLSRMYGDVSEYPITVLLCVCLYAAPSHVLDRLLAWPHGSQHNKPIHSQWHFWPKTVTLLAAVAMEDTPMRFTPVLSANMSGAAQPVVGETICLPGLTEVRNAAIDGTSVSMASAHSIAIPGTRNAFLPPLTVLTITAVYVSGTPGYDALYDYDGLGDNDRGAGAEVYVSQADCFSPPFSPIMHDALAAVPAMDKWVIKAFFDAQGMGMGSRGDVLASMI